MRTLPWKIVRVEPLFEEWKRLNGFPYLVSNYGRVRSLYTGRLLSPYLNSYNSDSQYLRVNLYRLDDDVDEKKKKKKKKKFYVHRLVGFLFVPGRSAEQWQIDHLDGNHWNNYFGNLEWVTPEENQRRKLRRLARMSAELAPF